tara:strand:+ start:222853 stop:224169 length:1317 start_codon:yes stop_codon:yes gene_type:complete
MEYSGLSIEELENLVEADKVHKRLYTDSDIFELEMDRVFAKAWIFVCHESQIPDPGDFCSSQLARESVIIVRHSDDTIKVLYNRCPHKGTQLTTAASGHVRAFRCMYHAWSFDTDGSLKARPLADAYEGSRLNTDNDDCNLKGIASVESYRGFVFARIHTEGPDLVTWLGEARTSIDNLVDRAPGGALEVVGPPLKYVNDCNWKMLVENVSDNLHALPTHRSASAPAKEMADSISNDDEIPTVLHMLTPFGSPLSFFEKIGQTICGNGHSFTGGEISIHSAYPENEDYNQAMLATHGEEAFKNILSVERHNTVIYPSLSLKCNLQCIRVFRPISVDETLLETWTFRLRGAPDEMLERSLLYNQAIFSPASIAGHDDNEAFCRMQQGLKGGGLEWVSLHRHMDAETHNSDGTISAPGTSDITYRHEYEAWLDYMRIDGE